MKSTGYNHRFIWKGHTLDLVVGHRIQSYYWDDSAFICSINVNSENQLEHFPGGRRGLWIDWNNLVMEGLIFQPEIPDSSGKMVALVGHLGARGKGVHLHIN